ncbi:phosphatidate cytidylyltransferase [Ligilactobacillus hayakitensis DSM 18933 = JCM 14209]|uniref:Phosphatidate cytidylyltransferase n=1 Tax=Ligilactobacillus hayakitensis DSM 18933 = JCM 14209 TaxID=1423755 RepID=A0A0R1WLU8_9LACO|nr:phosphatidate cytidylyltransferase [Ligilactobacillus hayakitensis]KRM18807.1 phosphatidate cytidylyltransferase [Ligilactobacillus hayakitensis DSM 18933 = JCM 14209]
MKQRVITAIIALLIFVPLLYLGGTPFNLLVMAMGLVAMTELLSMKKIYLVAPEAIVSYLAIACLLIPSAWFNGIFYNGFYFFVLVLLAFTVFSKNRFNFDDAGALILGSIYAGLGFHYMMEARHVGFMMILYAFLITWITDSGAYLFGRKFGKHKLAPNVSPNKTWEGSIGGTLSAVVIVGIYVFYNQTLFNYSMIEMLGLTLLFSIGAQFGDLIESAFKRYYEVKDSGKILPGHGGILDRFDSILLVLPLMHFAGLI